MKDRFGKPLYVAWSQTEIIWLEAAMTLKGKEKFDALWDVAAMTGRTYAAVLAKVTAIRDQREATRIEKHLATRRKNAAARLAVNGATKAFSPPADFRTPSVKQLMTGRR